ARERASFTSFASFTSLGFGTSPVFSMTFGASGARFPASTPIVSMKLGHTVDAAGTAGPPNDGHAVGTVGGVDEGANAGHWSKLRVEELETGPKPKPPPLRPGSNEGVGASGSG